MASNQRPTISGYNVWEVQSAIQKEVRRGREREAVRWAFEMESAGWWKALIKRLRVMCWEDVGPTAMQEVLFARAGLDDADTFYGKKDDSWRLPLTCAIVALCRAEKTRIGDELQACVQDDINAGRKPAIPDAALDKHTYRGKKMGRGFAHFCDEGAILEPDASTHREYREEAHKVWKALDGQPKSLPDGGGEPPPQTGLF